MEKAKLAYGWDIAHPGMLTATKHDAALESAIREYEKAMGDGTTIDMGDVTRGLTDFDPLGSEKDMSGEHGGGHQPGLVEARAIAFQKWVDPETVPPGQLANMEQTFIAGWDNCLIWAALHPIEMEAVKAVVAMGLDEIEKQS